jgi:hypothetical protein
MVLLHELVEVLSVESGHRWNGRTAAVVASKGTGARPAFGAFAGFSRGWSPAAPGQRAARASIALETAAARRCRRQAGFAAGAWARSQEAVRDSPRRAAAAEAVAGAPCFQPC